MVKGLIIMMRHLFLLLLLGLSLILIFSMNISVSASRTLKPFKDHHIIHPSLLDVDLLMDLSTKNGNREVIKTSTGVNSKKGRMVIELMDYPGTGANDEHNPKPPGTV